MSDAGLALLAQEGDAAAFEEIYDRHAAGVARALAPYAGSDRDAVNDLTQEVFYRVIEGLASYAPVRPFSHWLYTVTLNVGRNHARRASAVVSVEPDTLDTVPAKDRHSNDWSEEILATSLMRLVAALPDHVREVISLRIGSGMPFGEIAEVLGIPEGTARSRMHQALRILRERAGIPESRRETR